jgi:hypothetical protein
MKPILRNCLLLLALGAALLVRAAGAKGAADKITIAGPGIEAPLEITDPDILDRFNPWGGQFFGTGGPLEYPPYVKNPYLVRFYLENTKGEMELRYVLYYYANPSGGSGYLYLPGPGEPYYSTNAGLIMRGSADGNWHKALPAWDRVIDDAVRESRAGLGSRGGVNTPFARGVLTGSGGMLLLGLAFLSWYRLRSSRAATKHPGRRTVES